MCEASPIFINSHIAQASVKDLLRHPAQKITGNQTVIDKVEFTLNGIMKTLRSVTMGIYHFADAIVFSDLCEDT